MIADKECANRGCACYDDRIDKDGVQMYTKAEYEANHIQGWNAALEMAAFRLTHDFKSAFGEDTLASVAIYIKGFKR